ncbi:MAG TPA: EAL domain-containing protein [Ideonella sp.]|uniref:EAL domain-containing protein n=1 Tax=Ideonella sp. TaxID=1929293 RepID=UPI002D091AB3|nr:EAL domain-containing protein [Ideonella sp.]HSI47305.1 EAL domain-containing protein [Ideonella sp.]
MHDILQAGPQTTAAPNTRTVAAAGPPGLRLASAFQPILSLPHRRIVGHEALLRGQDASGQAVPPVQLFAARDAAGQMALDEAALELHLRNFAAQRQEPVLAPSPLWLFVNLRPASFLRTLDSQAALAQALRAAGNDASANPTPGLGSASPVVVEVTEEIVSRDMDFEGCAAQARALGCLLALDDFGAGHSNFDRVWRLQPEIVKLDRSLVQRGATEPRAARVIAQMVSLLHECGSLVLMEGVETADEAHLALDCDADLVQGYFFGRPQATLLQDQDASPQVGSIWRRLGQRSGHHNQADRQRIAPYSLAIAGAAQALAASQPMRQACAAFLQLPGAQLCYLLDEDGIQHGTSLVAPQHSATGEQRFAPMRDTAQACWARRPYFRRALDAPGTVQLTRPYLSVQGAHLCVTVSISLLVDGRTLVVCGDLAWNH